MNKDEVLFRKRLRDLAKTSYSRNIPIFTDFLTIYESSLLHSTMADFGGVRYELYGGYDFAERQMATLVPDAFLSEREESLADLRVSFPITVLKIEPVHKKFAENLTHRDYLGALTGLGLERCKFGDIVPAQNIEGMTGTDAQGAYVYCNSKIADYIINELSLVRHTQVRVRITKDIVTPSVQLKDVKGSVASLRLDAVVAMVCKLSRNAVIALFMTQKVFVNGRLFQLESKSYILKEGDVVSVRGFGKFIFKELLSMTKKERMYILVQVYGAV